MLTSRYCIKWPLFFKNGHFYINTLPLSCNGRVQVTIILSKTTQLYSFNIYLGHVMLLYTCSLYNFCTNLHLSVDSYKYHVHQQQMHQTNLRFSKYTDTMLFNNWIKQPGLWQNDTIITIFSRNNYNICAQFNEIHYPSVRPSIFID